MMFRLRRLTLMLSASTLLLGGCLPGPTMEPVAFNDPDIHVSTLALMRTTWDGTRPDAFCQPDIGNSIDWQLKKDLEKRGYRVLQLPVPQLDNSNRPDPAASLQFFQIQDQAPQGSDAIMRLRIVEYLDASLCDSFYEGKSLSITGIAEIFSAQTGEKIWETRQLCHDTSGRTSDVVYACTTQLTRRIVGHLPPR